MKKKETIQIQYFIQNTTLLLALFMDTTKMNILAAIIKAFSF